MTQAFENQLDEYRKVALEVAVMGGEVLKSHIGKLSDIREKSRAGDLVTEADHRSEEAILSHLKKKFPTHSIVSEEKGVDLIEGADFSWAVDPLDGTINFTHQVPFFAVSIALLFRGEPIVGVVYNPYYNECFEAVIGRGATLNGEKIHVSSSEVLSKSLLATGFAYDRLETPDNNYAEFCYLTSQTRGVRRMGSAAMDLAFVACGRFDGFWERGLRVWDVAAGIILVREAGGIVSSYENQPIVVDSGRILATNGRIHKELSSKLLRVHDELGPIIL